MSGLFSANEFYGFANSLRIETKEQGSVILGRTLMGSQRRLINEMVAGLEDGVHEFVTLKARQLGISTASLAVDLYLAGKYSGVSGALVVHDEPSRDQFRNTLTMYYDSLPVSKKRRIKQHNRNQLVFSHGTSLQYKVAGTKTKTAGTLGRSSAISFLHATECAFWGDPSNIDSLVSTMAQENPHRFYHWETTANGFNHFYDMWESAKDSVTKRAIFIGFWANERYRARRGTDVFNAYWGTAGRATQSEKLMIKECRTLYGVELDAEQIAWYRWYMREKLRSDEVAMWQEMPHTEFAAFVASGSQFFTSRSIGAAYRAVIKDGAPAYYRFSFGANFADTNIESTGAKVASLRIWDTPVKGAQYVLGADPAYGSSDSADRYVISVWRCYSDRIDQVAEYCLTDLNTSAFAWVMIYLAATYEPCTWNLEINGPGQAVLTELQNMTKSRTLGPLEQRGPLERAMGQIRNYLYRKYDSLYSQPTAIHTQTTYQQKERYLGAFKDYFERGMVRVRSRDLIDEMKSMVRVEGSQPQAGSRSKDDRVIAAALAIIAWNDQVRSRMMLENKSVQESVSRGAVEVSGVMASRVVSNMMEHIGFTESMRTPKFPGVSGGVPKQLQDRKVS